MKSGIAISSGKTGATCLNMFMHTLAEESHDLSLWISETGTERRKPPWLDILIANVSHFKKEQELKNECVSRTWCADISPFGDLLCIVHSEHPYDMVEYVGAVEQKCVVSISCFDSADDPDLYLNGRPDFSDGKISACDGQHMLKSYQK